MAAAVCFGFDTALLRGAVGGELPGVAIRLGRRTGFCEEGVGGG